MLLTVLMLSASLDSAVLQRDTARETDYIAPIERYIDSTMNGYDDEYDRLKERRHLREKNPHDGGLQPTWYCSPFCKRSEA